MGSGGGGAPTPGDAGVGFDEHADPGDFRTRVKAWFDRHAPAKGDPGDFSAIHVVTASSQEEYRARERAALRVTRDWQRTLFDAGLAGRSWPAEYGGHGAPRWHDDVVAEVQVHYGVSTKMMAVALEMVPPVLFAHGTDAQRLEHLPRVVRGEQSWCQLLSEPGAGSDLARVSTLATPVDGGWSVTGQKVWTSGAASSDFALLIARTDRSAPGRNGLSCFALPMSQPGVDVRPLRQLSGSYHFNEVFLDRAFVPHGGLIGDLGGGWTVLRTMLSHERSAIGGGTSGRGAVPLVALARRLRHDREAVARQEVTEAVSRERLLDLLQARAPGGTGIPAGGSVAKLLYSEHARLTADAGLELLGPAATAPDGPEAEGWIERFLFAPGLRIGGGTDEIQRNTIAERGLGLPREG
jgi:alkylation response protein AidB-like acyl-CoA dehydrogenase